MSECYDSKFKLKVALAAIKGSKTPKELCQEFGIEMGQFYAWKNQLEKQGAIVYVDKRKTENQDRSNEKKLQATIEKVTAERDFLARVLNH